MDLDIRILEKGRLEVERIKSQALLDAKKESDEILLEAKNDYDTKYKNVKLEVEQDIKTEEQMLFFETKQAELIAKQSVIKEIFEDIKGRILDLKEADLLQYVVNKISKESITGNEIIYTNKVEHKKYLKALSTSKKVNGFYDLDLLNSKLNTNLKLSEEYKDINGGFILESEFFDLNFAIDELIIELISKHEREIIKKLFE